MTTLEGPPDRRSSPTSLSGSESRCLRMIGTSRRERRTTPPPLGPRAPIRHRRIGRSAATTSLVAGAPAMKAEAVAPALRRSTVAMDELRACGQATGSRLLSEAIANTWAAAAEGDWTSSQAATKSATPPATARAEKAGAAVLVSAQLRSVADSGEMRVPARKRGQQTCLVWRTSRGGSACGRASHRRTGCQREVSAESRGCAPPRGGVRGAKRGGGSQQSAAETLARSSRSDRP
jgi:hypothetical protein